MTARRCGSGLPSDGIPRGFVGYAEAKRSNMPTYAIGDIQGCHRTLTKLLLRIEFDPLKDRLWLVGDLVNRGPRSLETLRWAREHDASITTVLGNHDLHLLACAAGLRKPKQNDTLEPILTAPDAPDLLDWLRRRPFLHCEDGFVMVHAGLLPAWTLADAETHAAALALAFRGPEYPEVLTAVYSKHPLDQAEATPDWRSLANVFTRIRMCARDGEPLYEYSGPPDSAPRGHIPWFQFPRRRHDDVTLLFGHWAALGLHLEPGIAALDSACVWGGPMTAVRLPDLAVFQEPNAE
jgi:bis(5'-nucleosyl)-tetraphosphatase (symmetrical)